MVVLALQKKKISINFSKVNRGNSYLFVNGKEIYKFKADNKYVSFPTQFV